MSPEVMKNDNDEYVDLDNDCTRVCVVGGEITLDGDVALESEYPEDSPHVSGDVGSFALGVRNDNNDVLTDANGDYSPLSVDATGALKVSVDGLAAEIGYANATVASVAAATSSTTLLAANPARRRVYVFNDSSSNLRLKFGTGASATSFTVLLSAQGFLELEPPCYVGEITAIWESATGFARVTEVTI